MKDLCNFSKWQLSNESIAYMSIVGKLSINKKNVCNSNMLKSFFSLFHKKSEKGRQKLKFNALNPLYSCFQKHFLTLKYFLEYG